MLHNSSNQNSAHLNYFIFITSSACFGPDVQSFQFKKNFKHNLLYNRIVRGTEAEIQLLLKRFPDSSVSSLIPTGWCRRASHHQKLAPTFPGIDSCLMVTKTPEAKLRIRIVFLILCRRGL